MIIRMMPAAGWPLVVSLAAVDLVVGLLPVAFVLFSSDVIGRVPGAVEHGTGSSQWHALIAAFALASGAFIVLQLFVPLQTSLGEVMKYRVDGHFQRTLITSALDSTGIGPMEDPATLDRLDEATEKLDHSWQTPGGATAGMLRYLSRYAGLLGYVVLVGAVSAWWVALLLLASTMAFRYGHRSGLRIWSRLWPVIGPHRRRRDYFRDLGMSAGAAKELRIFGLTGWVTGEFRTSAIASLKPMWKARRRSNTYNFLVFAAFGLVVDTLAVAYIVRSAASGEISLTKLALGLQGTIAAVLIGVFFHEADFPTQFGMNAVSAAEEFAAKVAGAVVDDIPDGAIATAQGLPAQTLRFDDVSFSYPGSGRQVLDGLDLTLNAGECTAIVGLNGAGKTTLVKLLARLYEPTSGALRVDGTDVRSFEVDAWRRQIGVIFQDFTRYQLSVTDNITVGAVERPVDMQAVRAAAGKVGLVETIEALPRGFDTPLARQYDDGADLSGGQWQRVAIARALYAVDAGARVLVLDEPTAALDVRAEAEFFDSFVDLTRGLTTLLISHRFSSVRRADRIVVLEHGRVIEDGTHESLLTEEGRYAELFHLQAERFAAGLDAEGAEGDEDDEDEKEEI
ncbi:ABC transporter ATP-binding protein [Actinospica robiniae]|uniref:ABC transporter ATP-binding protein n=1 Tax=Actinospica robiniae TaxID=304901 RepID=UPI000688C32E|nr:ABC transporter ATP-binding protein [Actinospica robiniae]